MVEEWHTNQPLLRQPHIIFGLCLDERLIHQQHWLSMGDLVSHFLHQAVGHILEHHRLQRERGKTVGLGALHQRAPAQCLDRIEDGPAADAWAQRGDQLGDGQRLTIHGQYAQNVSLDR